MQRYDLQGKTLSFASQPENVYLGVPECWCFDSETQHSKKINTLLLARPVNSTATWQALTAGLQGIYELSVQDIQGNIQFQQKCALLPENFALNFSPEDRRIDIAHSEQAYISCDSPLVKSINATAEGRNIEFNTTEIPPNTVDLILRWSGNRDKLILTVPFPKPIISRTRQVRTIEDIKTLAEAETIADDRLRSLFIRHLLKQLCVDFANEDWNTLRKLQNDAPLPASELWTNAIKDSRVLVALVLQLDMDFMQRFVSELSVCWELIPVSDWLVVFTRYKNHLALTMDAAAIDDRLNNRINKLNALSKSLHIIAQLLLCQLCAVSDDEELQFMQMDDALPLIVEQLQLEQSDLMLRQANSEWLDFFQEELVARWQTLPLQTQCLLSLDEVKHHNAVILLPLLLAHFALTHIPTASQPSSIQLNQLKAFDEYWFNTVFTLTLGYLSQQPCYTKPLQQEIAAMINSDENDLIAEIEQQIALANQEVQNLETDIHTLASTGNQEELGALLLENEQLNVTIENLSNIIKKRDDALMLLLMEVTNLNTKIREIRAEIQMKN